MRSFSEIGPMELRIIFFYNAIDWISTSIEVSDS